MKKLKLPLLTFLLAISMASFSQSGFYDFKVKTLEGEEFDFSSLKGKKVMIVNTASKCGFTPQYKELQELYEQYQDDFVVIGFPSNDFAHQEPGSSSDIRQFCNDKYGVKFPIMEKVSVKGDNMAPVYKWLTSKNLNGKMDSDVKWNFQKYLIDENGMLIEVIAPKEKPNSERVITWISSD